MSYILLNLNTIVSFICLLMAAHLFWQQSFYQLPIKLLAGCFLTLGLQALFLGLRLSSNVAYFASALQPAMPLLFAAFSYLMFISARSSDFQLLPKYLVNLLPATIVPVLMFSKDLVIYTDYVVIFTLLIYAVLHISLSVKGSGQFNLKNKGGTDSAKKLQNTIYVWLLVFTGYSCFSFLSDLLIFLEVKSGTDTVESIALLITVVFKLFILSFTIFFALQKSPHFDWVYLVLASINDENKNTKNSEDYSKIINLFETILKEPEVYTTEVLSLKAMSDRIGVPTRLFSNAINHHYGESYSKYMNRMRIKFAEKLLKDNPELSIINIMYDSGFRTKSSFNREFKAIAGVSPTKYRSTL